MYVDRAPGWCSNEHIYYAKNMNTFGGILKMSRELTIIKMSFEHYMEKYGYYYEAGELWDYPLSELDYLLSETESTKFALVDNRLYEIKVCD